MNFETPNYYDMMDKIWEITGKCSTSDALYVDAVNPQIISNLKRELEENKDWNYIHVRLSDCKKYSCPIEKEMKDIPVSFSVERTFMLAHVKLLIENQNRIIAIRPEFEKLITSLKTAVTHDTGRLDK